MYTSVTSTYRSSYPYTVSSNNLAMLALGTLKGLIFHHCGSFGAKDETNVCKFVVKILNLSQN